MADWFAVSIGCSLTATGEVHTPLGATASGPMATITHGDPAQSDAHAASDIGIGFTPDEPTGLGAIDETGHRRPVEPEGVRRS